MSTNTDDGKYQTAVLYNGKVYVSSNYGETWNPKGINLYSSTSVSVSSNGKYQTLTALGIIYVSSDYGETWNPKTTSTDWMYISISSSGKYQTVFNVDGTIYTSSNYGETWNPKVNIINLSCVSVSSSGKYQTAVVENGNIYISSNFGETWNPKYYNKYWLGVSMSSNGQYQTACGYGAVYISSDYGINWTPKLYINSYTGVSLSSSGQYQTTVAFGGQIYVSSDYGQTWNPRDSNRNWKRVSLSSSGKYQTSVLYYGKIYVSSNFGQTWTLKDTNTNEHVLNVSVNKALPTCKNNTNVFFILKDVDDFVPYNDGTNTYDLMNAASNNNLFWNPLGTSGQCKIIVSFSEPINITKIYFKFTNTNDEQRSATSLVVYPNIYIGNSTNSNVSSLKMTPEPTAILTISNVNTNVSNNYNYYISNPVVNTDTNFYTDYTLVFNKPSSNQMYLSYLNFDIDIISVPSKIQIVNSLPNTNSIDLNIKIPSSGLPISKYNITGYSPNGCKFTRTITRPEDNSNQLFNTTAGSNYTINVDNLRNTGIATYNSSARDCGVNETYDYVVLPYKNISNKNKIKPITQSTQYIKPISKESSIINVKKDKTQNKFNIIIILIILLFILYIIVYYCKKNKFKW